MFSLKKYEKNPILQPSKLLSWEKRCVLNPAVVYDETTKKFIMLYRCAGNDIRHKIKMGIAFSDDGFNFKRASFKPVFDSHLDEPDGGCVEDPRMVKIGDTFFITYAARAYTPGRYWLVEPTSNPRYITDSDVVSEESPFYAKNNTTVSYLAMTKDFKTFKKLGRITNSNYDDRDVMIFPEKVNGKYVRISRPKIKDAPVKMPSIWISFGDDILEYEKPTLLLTGQEEWEMERMGACCPPIKTEEGWLMFYHGVNPKDHFYRVGAVLLDLNDPRKILARTKNYIMQPEEEYETNGLYNGCVFPTGNVLKDGLIYLYYGCADRVIAMATVKLDDILNHLLNECKL